MGFIRVLCSAMAVASLALNVVGTPTTRQARPIYQCGKTDVIFVALPLNYPRPPTPGLPPFDPKVGAALVAQENARILKAGYNIKTIFIGLEQPLSILADNLYRNPSGVVYDVATIGYGVRSPPFTNTTIQFENEIELFRERIPLAPLVFGTSPNTTLDALKRKAPISGDCSNKPGKDYGTFVYCDPKLCTEPLS